MNHEDLTSLIFQIASNGNYIYAMCITKYNSNDNSSSQSSESFGASYGNMIV
jgi:hypothetical protein